MPRSYSPPPPFGPGPEFNYNNGDLMIAYVTSCIMLNKLRAAHLNELKFIKMRYVSSESV